MRTFEYDYIFMINISWFLVWCEGHSKFGDINAAEWNVFVNALFVLGEFYVCTFTYQIADARRLQMTPEM